MQLSLRNGLIIAAVAAVLGVDPRMVRAGGA
jgi:hypothetical protein